MSGSDGNSSTATSTIVEPDATAEEREVVLRVVDALDGFLLRHDVPAGAVAIGHDGRRVGSGGIGRAANEPAPVASLSKAITAVCAVETLATAGVPLSTSIGTLLPEQFERVTEADARLADISVAQLFGHDSGLRDDHVTRHFARFSTHDEERIEEQFDTIASVELLDAPGSGYRYSNANYLILGLVIEAVGGRHHEEACLDTVLRPAGVESAAISRSFASESSFGGWEISAVDYLKFIDTWFRGANNARLQVVTDEVRKALDVEVSYGLGVLMRARGSSFNIWHDGSFLWIDESEQTRYGAFFAAFPNGYTVAVNFAIDGREGRGPEIDQLVYDAVHDPVGSTSMSP